MTKNFFENKDYNTPVFETNNFVVVPSLGSLIEGWLLIVPKAYYLNFSQLSEGLMAEVDSIVQHLQGRLLPLFENEHYVLFEHGPADLLSKAGCGVDYAHLHWVPFGFDLLKGVHNFLGLDFAWQEIDGLKDIRNRDNTQQDYLYLQDQDGRHFLTSQFTVPSQTFRQVIAHYLKQPERYDWKAYDGAEHIRSVYDKLTLID